jgi:hypothetical protein
MARKLLPPTAFNAAAVRESAKAGWLEKRRKSVTVLERIERSQPYWLFFILFAVILLSASHTTAAFQQVIGTKIYINADLSIPLGSVGVIAIEFGLLYASFGRFRAHQKRVRIEPMVLAMEVIFFISAIVINGTGSINVLSDQHLVGGQDDGKIAGGLFMVVIAAVVVPISLVIVGTGIARLVYERKIEPDRFAEDWLRDGPDVLHLAFHDELLRLGESPSRANTLAGQLVRATFKTTPAKPAAPEPQRKAPEKPESTGTEQEGTGRPKSSTNAAIARLHTEYPGFPQLPLSDQVDLVIHESGRGESATYAALEKYRKWIAAGGDKLPVNGGAGPNNGTAHNG